MSQLEAIAKSVSECCSLSSSGSILEQCRPPSSSRSPGITCPEPVMTMARMSSSSHVLFDSPSQVTFSTHDPINYDIVIALPSSLGVPATPTSSLLSSFVTTSRATSRVVVMRRADSKEKSPETTSFSDAASSATPATDSKGGGTDKTTTKTGNNGTTPPGHASTTAVPDTGAQTTTAVPDIGAQTTTVTSYYTSSQYDTASPLTTTIASAITSSTSVSSSLVKGPQELVSQTSAVMVTITSEWTSGGHTYHTTMTLGCTSPGSVQPSPTGTVASPPSASKSSLLPLILGLVFGVVFLVAFAVILHKFRARWRRQAELLPQPLSDHGNHNYQDQLLRDPTPPVTTQATLERRPRAPPLVGRISDRLLRDPTSPVATQAALERRPRAPPLVGRISDWRSRCRSQGDSSEPMSEVLSDPFADGSFAVSSRTSEPAANNPFAVFGESLSTLHTSDYSELNILAPIPSNAGTSIHSSYLSPTGHYHERHPPPAMSAEDTTERSSLVFHAGSGRLRALLDEARRT
ncbi:hypothetical protein EV702DRAFT_779484 [Suillus placidus]|uniref:Uncharacterized protein n=1 Tax=Suillus placidus TaxID=48579 RepID=A0A9P7D4Y5_9AGAM|nr:hypothetical protein EV702DRAFT_779484 [Suillus placidus]